MIGTIAQVTTAAAPHVVSAVGAGTQAVVGMAVAAKASGFAKTKVGELLEDYDEVKAAVKQARSKDADITVTEVVREPVS